MKIESNLFDKSALDVAEEYQIIFMSPITYNESRLWHLMLVTKNGLRIYISFETRTEIVPTDLEIEKANM